MEKDNKKQETDGNVPELSGLLAAYRKLACDMSVLFARKKIFNARVGGQVVGMETYRLTFTGSELGNIWQQMEELEKLAKQVWYP